MRGERQSKIMEIYGSKGEILGEGGGGARKRTIFFSRASVFVAARPSRALCIYFHSKVKEETTRSLQTKGLRIPTGRRQTSWLLRSFCLAPGVVKDLNMGLTASG